VVVVLAIAGATQAAAQLRDVPVRPLGNVVGSTVLTSYWPMSIRQLSDGRVWINDPWDRVVLQLDARLANPVLVMDSVAGRDNSYGGRGAAVIPFLGDSALFVDRASLSLRVLDPAGKAARVIPISRYVLQLVTAAADRRPRIDAGGRLVFQGAMNAPPARSPTPNGLPRPVTPANAAFVLALNLTTQKLDTVTTILVLADERMVAGFDRMPSPPLAIRRTDDWAVTSRGQIAVLRGRDYHVDWLYPLPRSTSPPIPFPWTRLSDAEKARLADSITTVRDSANTAQWAAMRSDMNPIYDGVGHIVAQTTLDNASSHNAGFWLPGRSERIPPVPPLSIPDSLPAFEEDALLADANGRLWIKPRAVRPRPGGGGTVYDIVDERGALIDRVELPMGRSILGFGAGGVVYLLSNTNGVKRLEKALFR
jgi:hypothetical protein